MAVCYLNFMLIIRNLNLHLRLPNVGKIIYVKHLQLDTRHLPEMDKLQLIDVGRLIKDKYLHGSRVKNVTSV